ncbi:MAG TPA: ABC transporter permease subunit [Gemmatimonadaceae bacterium]|nr:ABC transporter permease subunit [Gemmatimonadaceae bacterium]
MRCTPRAGWLVPLAASLAAAFALAAPGADAQQLPALRWAGDSEGGAPYVEADPRNPGRVVGLDVEIAELIAKELDRSAEFAQIAFTSLDQSAARGDFDIALDGIEDTPARRASLAVCLGAVIATGRVYGNRLLRVLFTAYVEVTRGTPILLQLFVIYYGLASVVRLPAFVAALIGLGLNYAAYESEIYRGALEAVPR